MDIGEYPLKHVPKDVGGMSDNERSESIVNRRSGNL
jgi:hypothetical protein